MRRAHLLAFVAVAAVLALGCDKKAPAAAGATAAKPKPEAAENKAPALCDHGVPADQCTRCNPELAETFKALGDWCDEHGVPESHCRECNPRLTFDGTEPEFPPPGTKVRLATSETAVEAGIQTRPVARTRFAQTLEVVGQLDFNHNRHAQLTSRGDALVEEVKVDVGDEVRKGQPLVVLTSSSVGSDQARLSAAASRIEAARAAVEREQRLVSRGISPQTALEEAKRELGAAQSEHDAARASLNAAGANGASTSGRFVLKAPFDGAVVDRRAVAGRTTQPGEVLIELADLNTLWAQLDVPEEDAHLVRPGQKVELQLDGSNAPALPATISRVGASIDPRTRTVSARVELPNPDRTLRAGHFLRARIEVSGERDAILIPRDAVQRAEGRDLVFVATGEGVYKPVRVKLGARTDADVEILEGLDAGAKVVTTGAFLLKTEILKESIGAGCCDVEEKE